MKPIIGTIPFVALLPLALAVSACSGDSPEADVGSLDMGVADMNVVDTGQRDLGTPDTGVADLAVADMGPDMGPADMGPADMGPADMGPADMGMGDGGIEGTVFVATLSGAEENPPITTAAIGNVMMVLSLDEATLSYELTQNVPGVTMAHIHRAQAGVNGPVVQALGNLDGTPGTVPMMPADVTDLKAGRLYVNVHSGANPGGEIRGQIMEPGEELLVGVMTGAQQNPPIVSVETGAFATIINGARTEIRFELTTSFTPTAAHIHAGLAGVNGGVAYPLQPTGAQISGTLTVNAADVDALRSGEWYVNAHTSTNAGGEVRGQVIRPGETVFHTTLSGAQENPPVVTAETANGQLLLSHAQDSVRFVVVTSAVVAAAHVHEAPAAVNGGVVFPLGAPGPRMTGTVAATPENVTALRRGLWYFNVHTAANAGGELRGQILGVAETLYSASLSGDQEVPPVVTQASGGIGFILNAEKTSLRYNGVYTLLTPAAAHVHDGVVGANGGVRFPLTYGGGTFEGEQVVVDADVVAFESGDVYSNAHTVENAGGEIRGQITRK